VIRLFKRLCAGGCGTVVYTLVCRRLGYGVFSISVQDAVV